MTYINKYSKYIMCKNKIRWNIKKILKCRRIFKQSAVICFENLHFCCLSECRQRPNVTTTFYLHADSLDPREETHECYRRLHRCSCINVCLRVLFKYHFELIGRVNRSCYIDSIVPPRCTSCLYTSLLHFLTRNTFTYQIDRSWLNRSWNLAIIVRQIGVCHSSCA